MFFRYFTFILLSLFLSSCTSMKLDQTYESRAKKSSRKFTPVVVIDPGHGGFDLGAHTNFCEEKEACLRTAHYLRRHLEKRGYRVIMTRNRDEYLPLKTRAKIANDAKCQVLVSLHYNAAQSSKAHGLEVFYFPKAEPWRKKRSKQLAAILLDKLLTQTGALSRGVKEGNFCVIRETDMPSVLVEGGFITNEIEQKKIKDDRYLNKIAVAIANGLDHYFDS